jgi:hypothetical protein
MVNRVWQHLFGEGLVRTPDDFGVFGAAPEHPELLEHLAARFIADGWSLKRLIRTIARSRAYQLASQCDPRLVEADPGNALVGRHTQRRLEAEALRDAVLSASGQLDLEPPLGSLLQHQNVLINEMGNLHKPSRHRSVYLLMLRTAMPPELTAFNLPDALSVAGKRELTTLPTQALFLLNSPFFVEQSRHFANAILPQQPYAAAESVRAAYRRALSRNPTSQETARALEFIKKTGEASQTSHSSLSSATRTAWIAFCQALFASNEFRYID